MIILGTNSIKAAGGFNVDNSLRFNDGSQDSLQRSPSSASNRRTWTWSGWIKRSNLGADQIIFSGGSANTWIRLLSSDKLEFNIQDNDESTIVTTQLFRDISAWSHIVVAIDTTQGTASNRIKFYVNGNQVTSFSTSVYVSQNYEAGINNTGAHYIGRLNYAATQWFDGYMSEVCFIDGQQLAADQFGEFDEDSGIWKPIDVSGLTFGTNGFYLEFKESGTGTNASGMGADTSGNTNHFAVNNLTSLDQSTDTCSTNFATLNPLNQTVSGGVFSEGNLTFTRGGNALSSVSTFAITTGKWYWEWKQLGGNTKVGVGSIDTFTTKASSNAGTSVVTNAGGAHTGGLNTYAYSKNGKSFSQTKDGNNSGVTYGDTWTTNDIIGCAFDATNGTIWFSKNGTWQDSATISEIQNGTTTNSAYSSIASDTFYVIQDGEEAAGVPHSIAVNFGSPPFAISSGNTDGDGYGNFEYAVPSGYFALNTKNLSEYG